MVISSGSGVRFDTKSWITLVEANACHQANIGSVGISPDLVKALRSIKNRSWGIRRAWKRSDGLPVVERTFSRNSIAIFETTVFRIRNYVKCHPSLPKRERRSPTQVGHEFG